MLLHPIKKPVVSVLFCAMLLVLSGCKSDHVTDPNVTLCPSQPEDAKDIEIISSWMRGLQYTHPDRSSDGAMKIHHTPGYIAPNQDAYFRVIPYFSNLALVGLLNTKVPDKLKIAKKEILWHLKHLNMNSVPPDLIYDHWYLADGTGETTCPPGITPSLCNHDDASDSYAATFLGLLWAYHQAGGTDDFLKAEGNKEKFEQIASVILALQQPDGLTWAKSNFRVKYLMDNSEVYWGLTAISELEKIVFHDEAKANQYKVAAENVQNGIRRFLFNTSTGLYHIAKFEDDSVAVADLNVWYPGTVAIVWPHLFGATDSRSDQALTQMAALNESWDGSPHPDWTKTVADSNGFVWPAISHAAFLTDDCDRAARHIAFVKSKKFPDFPWPFDVSEAGWLLMTLGKRPG